MQVSLNKTTDKQLQSNPIDSTLQISEDFLNKQDFEFKSQNASLKSLKVLNKLSYVASALSLYQFIYSTAALVYFQSTYNADSAWISLASLIISITLAVWSSIILRAEENKALFSHETVGGRWEIFYQTVFTVLMFRIAGSFPVIANLFYQGNGTVQHIKAAGFSSGASDYQRTATIMNGLALPLPFVEILLLGFFVQAGKSVFGYIKERSETISRMIFLGNIVFMGSALGLVFYSGLVEFSPVNFSLVGTLMAALAGLIWLVNHGKWRVTYVAATLFLTGMVVGLGALSSYSFNQTHQLERQEEGLVKIEVIQAGAFLTISNLSLIGTMSGLLILIGLAYFWRNGWRDVGFRSKHDYKYLGVLALMVVAFFAISSVSESHQQKKVDARDYNLDNNGVPFAGTINMIADSDKLYDVLPFENSVILADGSDYGNVWNALRSQAYQFIVFKKSWNDPSNPSQIRLEGGPWGWGFEKFFESIEPIANQVAFIFIGSGSQAKLVMVVYAPTALGKTSTQVLDDYRLPTNPNLLQSYGINVAKTVVVADRNAITLSKLQEGLTTAPVTPSPSTTPSTSTSSSSADGSTYADVWKSLNNKEYRFFVFSRNPSDPRSITVQRGSWSSVFYNFAENFKANQEQVGFYWASGSGGDQLYEVVYAPTSVNLSPSQILTNFGLPTDPAVLQQKFQVQLANTYVARQKEDIDVTKVIMNSKRGGVISMLSLDNNSNLSMPFANSVILADGSDYGNVWNALRSQAYQFIVFKKSWNDPSNPNQIRLEGGPWGWSFEKFFESIEPIANQVAFIFIGSGSQAKLVMVVYAPTALGKTSTQVLDDYRLPTNPNLLQSYGINVAKTVVVADRNAITLSKLQEGLTTAPVTPSASTTPSTPTSTTSSSADGSTYADVWKSLNNKEYRFFVFSRNPSDPRSITVQRGSWSSVFYNFAENFKANQEQVGFYWASGSSGDQLYEVVYAPTSVNLSPSQILNGFGLPTDPAVLQQKFQVQLANTYVARQKEDIDVTKVIMNSKRGGVISMLSIDNSLALNLPTEASMVLSADGGSRYLKVWEGLKNKEYRFIIFKREWENPSNPNKLKLEGGPWEMTFDDFYASIEPQANQVGFVYVGDEGEERLVRVVFNPTALEKTSVQVLESFQIPEDASQLKQFGLTIEKTVEIHDKKSIIRSQFEDRVADGSLYAPLWEELESKNYRFLVFTRNETDSRNTVVQPGLWNSLFFDFVDAFKPNQEQVGYYFVSTKTAGDQLYQIILTPPESESSPAQILTSYGLPADPSVLHEKFDLPLAHTYIARQKREIDLETILKRSNAGAVVNL